jgi:hypothetical protein
LHGGRIQTAIFQYSPPTRFGVVFRDVLADARNVTVYLHATVTGLDSADGVVTHARVACGRAPRFAVSAGLFILAAGGIDNARLLLLSGLGNRHDLVGRFFMEHPHLDCGRGITFEAPRHSLMTAVKWEIFDDLLIGNFMRTTLHGRFPETGLYPDFTPYVAKYGDNGLARSDEELGAYFAAYRRRAPLEFLRHRLEKRSIEVVRAFLPVDSGSYRLIRSAYHAAKRR